MIKKEIIFNCIGTDDYKSAIKTIDEALILEGNNAYYLYLKGYCFSRMGNYLKTISLCKNALEAGLKAEECYLLMGQSYVAMGWVAEAKENFLLGLEVNPENPELKAAYAFFLLKNENPDNAYAIMLEAIKANINNFMIIHYAIYFYLNRKNINIEKHWLIKIYLESSSCEIINPLKDGLKAFENQKFKVARLNFERAHLLDPENEAILEMLDELNLKAKTMYKPLVIIDWVGGWIKWGEIAGLLGSIILFMFMVERSRLLYTIVVGIFILWICMGIYKFILELLYIRYYIY